MGLLAVVALVTTGLLAVASAEPREQFVFRLLSVYQSARDQTVAADRDKNGVISQTEFLQSLFFFTDKKRDRRVTQAEFVDGYRRQFGLPAELLVLMFDLLDDLNDDGGPRRDKDKPDNRNNKFFDMFGRLGPDSGLFSGNKQQHGDGVLTTRDVNIRKFIGNNKQPTKDEYKKSLLKWVAAAADRLYSINYQPHIPGNPWDTEFDYERWFQNVDRNNDSLVSFTELRDEFRRYNSDGRVSRGRWVDRNLAQYGDREWLANVVFDYWDKNKDLTLDDLDVGLILKEADRNRDMRVTTVEFHRFMEKYNKRARRRLATPIRPVMYDCPSPWWQSFGCRPRVDATRAAMDMDDNFDGWITQGELRKRVSYYDRNGDGWASRMEVMMVESMRYGVKGPVAAIMFDIYDRNGDGRYDNDDLRNMLPGGRVLCFCDARRAVLDLVQLSQAVQSSPAATGPAGSLRGRLRWRMMRQWRWRRRVERLWHGVWGRGGGRGGTCRQGDCTGKDWRGGSWYSPFDWRQRNRVPENFLQWSYLRNVPRTVSFPTPFFPGRRPSWTDRQWPQGDGGYGGKADGRANFGGTGQAPVSGQFPSDVMPPGFMPNPSNRPAQPPPPLPPASSSYGDSDPGVSGQQPWQGPTDPPQSAKPGDGPHNQGPSAVGGGVPPGRGNGREVGGNWMWNRKQAAPSPGSRGSGRGHVNVVRRTTTPSRGLGGTRWGPGTGNSRSRRDLGDVADTRTPVTNSDPKQSTPAPLPPPATLPTDKTDLENQTAGTTVPTADANVVSANASVNDSSADSSPPGGAVSEAGKSDSVARSMGGSPMYGGGLLALLGDGDRCPQDDTWLSGDGQGVDGLTADFDGLGDYGNSAGFGGFGGYNGFRGNGGSGDYNGFSSYGNQGNYGPEKWGKYRYWPGFDNNPWKLMWNSYHQPRFSRDNQEKIEKEHTASRRSTDSTDTQEISRMMGGYGGYSPQWWNSYRYWPGHMNNWMWNYYYWMGRNNYPFYFAKGDDQLQKEKEHTVSKRSTDDQDEVSRMMGGYGGYWPQWWNNNRYWPGHMNNWMWNNYGGYPYYISSGNGGSQYRRYKRSTDNENDKDVSRMMGGYGGYWPQRWNSNRYWPGHMNNWMWNNYQGYPYYFSSRNDGLQNGRFKRSTDNENDKDVSKMMGGYGGYWPQWWNSYRYWPGHMNNWMWNNYYWMGRNNYPFYFAKGDDQLQKEKEHTVSKRSTDDEDGVSRMMGGYGGYWPQWWNSNRYWPGRMNNWMWNNYQRYPYYFSSGNGRSQYSRFKRSTEYENDKDVSRMMGGYGGYWPQWWNNNRYWPGRMNNWMWNNYQRYPYYFSSENSGLQNRRFKRSTDNENDKDVSKMMGGYGGYWPQWWNSNRYWPGQMNNWMWNNYQGYPYYFSSENGGSQYSRFKRSTDYENDKDVSKMMGGYAGYTPQWWNSYRYWPGQMNNWMWNNYYWMGRNNYPFYFAKGDDQLQKEKEHTVSKRSTDDQDEVSRMMGGYGGYWPQWWNNNRYWPGHMNNWMWNNYQRYPYYFSSGNGRSQYSRFKRSTEYENDKDVSKMMGGYGGYWPQWWNNNRYWPGHMNNWMWNNYQRYPYYFSSENSGLQNRRFKRSTDNENDKDVSRMMGGYGSYWPQWWNNNRYWPGQMNNWMWNYNYWMGRNNYPFYFAKRDDQLQKEKEHTVSKRSADGQDEVSRMMGGYGSYWPQWWNNNRYWPGHMNNWMWNNYYWMGRNNYPFYFAKGDDQLQKEKEHTVSKRSTDDEDGVSRMMGIYGSYWPQWWNNNRYWPGHMNNWMWNYYYWMGRNNYPFYFAKGDDQLQKEKEHTVSKRSTDDQDEVSRMMGGYGGYWPQWWNSNRYWPGHMNNWMWNNYQGYPYYFSSRNDGLQNRRYKRSTDNENDKDVSRMMGGYGGYWPQWWNSYRYWPGHMNNWMWNYNYWMGRNNYPFYFAKGDDQLQNEKEHTVSKRSTDDEDGVSRMMGGYGGYWPQWWNSNRYWPGRMNNWMWNNYQRYPYYFSSENSGLQNRRFKRSTDNENDKDVSKMMGGYGGYWPQWWNSYRYWPGYMNNWMWNNYYWMGRNNYPFYFAKGDDQLQKEKEHTVSKRSTDDEDGVSRMMGGYGGYWPQWWNSNRYWPGRMNNWMWNNYQRYPYYFSSGNGRSQYSRFKRSTEYENDKDVSKMMGGYGGYWPQWWNNNRYWPGHMNNWMWNNYQRYPYYFSSENSGLQNRRFKRSTDNENDKDVSRMMGGYGGYWPQWWNNNRYWPGYMNNWMWNNYYWMGRNNYPFYFAKGEDQLQKEKEHTVSKRSADGQDEVSRMMGGYGGYWPQWWNNNRYWPGHMNNWMWNNYQRYPYYFSSENSGLQNRRFKRSTDNENDKDVSRMMGGYGGYWPQWWNNNRYWPGYMNNWMWNNYYWMGRNNYPFYFAKGEDQLQKEKEHTVSKRSADGQDEVSRMMGGYGGYWPQWWNNNRYWPGHMNNWMWNNYQGNPYYFSSRDDGLQNRRYKRSTDNENDKDVSRMMGGYGGYWPQWWNSYRYWPGHMHNWMWNYNYWMGRNNYPFYFAKGDDQLQNEKEHTVSKRSTDDDDEVSRMMGGYGGYWPQWWNSNRYWPGRMNWMWNNYQRYPYYFSSENSGLQNRRFKRSTDNKNDKDVSKMMGGYGGYWPQWWNSNRYWPGQMNNWMWNNYQGYPYYFSSGNGRSQYSRFKRSTEYENDKDVSKMMGGYGGYWPQWWNNNRYWPGHMNNWMWNNYQRYPYYFSSENSGLQNRRFKRSTDNENDKDVSRMMGGYGGYWPQWWNNNRYWPGYMNNWMWNNYYWMGRNNYPFYFAKGDDQLQKEKEHTVSKRSADGQDEVSRMMGGYGGYWPQWWNNNRYWPGHMNNWMWNNYQGNPYYFSSRDDGLQNRRYKRSTDNENDKDVSRMMGGYGGYWPQWWNSYRYWPGHMNNWMWNYNYWMGRNNYPFYFAKGDEQLQNEKEHTVSKRSTDDEDEVSRMMGGYGGYWPQWWNSNRYWPGRMNWMWNNYQRYPYYFSSENSGLQNRRFKRSTDNENDKDVSKMMGGYGGYWPQWWNSNRYWPGQMNNWMWNNYQGYPYYFSSGNGRSQYSRFKRSTEYENDKDVSKMMGGYGGYWPQWWNNNRYWPGHMNNWMWNNYQRYPYYFSSENSGLQNRRFKRSTDNENDKDVSRMMGGYGGYWPQWWNNNRYWPGQMNNWMWNYNYWMGRNNYPFYFAKGDDQLQKEKEHTVSKRSADGQDEVSRMMGGYGGYWPQWWNNNRYWPGHMNNWMWNNYQGYPYYFSSRNDGLQNRRYKRSTDNKNDKDVSRMMGGYGGYWPQWWNSYRHWPGYMNNWMWNYNYWMGRNNYPFYFAKGDDQLQKEKEHTVSKRSTDDEDGVSRMMGGYGGYWPQWWNSNRYWPGQMNNWMWNNYQGYPYYFSSGNGGSQYSRFKRSTDYENDKDVSKMMGGYGGYWPQWWNSYRYWPGHMNNWMWNNYYWMGRNNYPFYFAKGDDQLQKEKEHTVSKRSTDDQDEVSRMMGGYGGYWPQWWNNNRYWPGHMNNWMWNNYQRYPYYFSSENGRSQYSRFKRSPDSENDKDVSKMMGGYGGYWSQWWNNNRYWPGHMNNWMWNNYQRYPYYFSSENSGLQNRRFKRSTDNENDKDVSKMMGGYGGYWPQWWNSNRYWPGHINNWMWNYYQRYPYYFSSGNGGSQYSRFKRSPDSENDKDVSKMMGGYGGYWPQWGNSYRYWPGHMNNWMWNNYYWMGRNNYPFYFADGDDQLQKEKEHTVSKRSTDDQDEVSRMMGGYDGYWPQWSNSHIYPPGHRGIGDLGGTHRNMWSRSELWPRWMLALYSRLFATSSQADLELQVQRGEDGVAREKRSPHLSRGEVNSRKSGSQEQREKRDAGSEAGGEEARFADAEDPEMARHMSAYKVSPKDLYRQQLATLYTSFLRSRPTSWNIGSYDGYYTDPSWEYYRNGYDDLYGRYYYVRLSPPHQLYRRPLRPTGQNKRWPWDRYSPAWTFYVRNAPYFYASGGPLPSPAVRQQTDGAVTGEDTDKASTEEQHRDKRSAGYRNYGSFNPSYSGGDVYDFNQFYNPVGNSWRRQGPYGMYTYNTWPAWNGPMNQPRQQNFNHYGPYGNKRGWSGAARSPFQFSNQDDVSTETSAQQREGTAPKESATPSDRLKRSTEHGPREAGHSGPTLSRWTNFEAYRQPQWYGNGWNQQTPGWGRGRPGSDGDRRAPPWGFPYGHGWNGNPAPGAGMTADGWNRPYGGNGPWSGNSYNRASFPAFSMSRHPDPQQQPGPNKLHKRSADVTGSPTMARWQGTSGYQRPPWMTSFPAPGMMPQWRFGQYSSHHQQWVNYNGWHNGHSWSGSQSGFSQYVPRFPFRRKEEESGARAKIREKRSSEDGSRGVRDAGQRDTESQETAARLGRHQAPFFNWNGPTTLDNRRRFGYYQPTLDGYSFRPWWWKQDSSDQYQHHPFWSQYQKYPSWNQYLNNPSWGQYGNNPSWGQYGNNPSSGQYPSNPWNQYGNNPSWGQYGNNPSFGQYPNNPSWNQYGSVSGLRNGGFNQNKMKDIFRNENVDENLFDPLSSFYFSHKDTSTDDLGKESAEKRSTAAGELTLDKVDADEVRVRRSAQLFNRLLFRKLSGQGAVTDRKHAQMLSKVKRFSSEAEARLQRRFQKRSPGPSEPTADAGLSAPAPETAPASTARATAPAVGKSTRDREWGPPRGGQGPQPARPAHGQDPGQHTPAGRYQDGRGWSQPGWDGDQDWVSGQGAGQSSSGRPGQPATPDTGKTDGADPTDFSDADGTPGSGGSGEGEDDGRLSNYNYIDRNNPDSWGQFYNPPNSSLAGTHDNSSQWRDWFGLWAYAPNFWDDVDDLDLWDGPWGPPGQGVVSPWAGGWVGPEIRYTLSPPRSARGWYWLGDCHNRRHGHGLPYGERLVAVVEDGPRYLLAPLPYRPLHGSLRLGLTPSGSGAARWLPPLHAPWTVYGDVEWRRFPFRGWNPNSFWNPWRYRIQYHNDLDSKVLRHRRSPSGSSHDQPPTPPAPAYKGPVGTGASSSQRPGSVPTPRANPPALGRPSGPYPAPAPNYGGWGGQSMGQDDGAQLPWWDKNNWHVDGGSPQDHAFPSPVYRAGRPMGPGVGLWAMGGLFHSLLSAPAQPVGPGVGHGWRPAPAWWGDGFSLDPRPMRRQGAVSAGGGAEGRQPGGRGRRAVTLPPTPWSRSPWNTRPHGPPRPHAASRPHTARAVTLPPWW